MKTSLTIGDLLVTARRRLAATSFAAPAREATLLLAHTLGLSEAQVIARHDERLASADLARFEAALARRLTGEPVAYILGFREFYGRPFTVDSRVLIPRPETEHLVEAALELPLPVRPVVADLGTGSGCIACTLALELSESRLVATDLSLGALAVAGTNRRRHGLTDRVALVAADLAAGLELSAFDLVVSNPPYIGTDEADSLSPEILDHEPAAALFGGPDGELFHRRILDQMRGLRSGAWLVLEIGAGQRETLARLTLESAFELSSIRPDYAGHPRTALLRRR